MSRPDSYFVEFLIAVKILENPANKVKCTNSDRACREEGIIRICGEVILNNVFTPSMIILHESQVADFDTTPSTLIEDKVITVSDSMRLTPYFPVPKCRIWALNGY
jgi:hypothetical protein